MPDYKSSNVTGYQWRRCKQVVIRNYLNQVPYATFLEEDCVTLPDGSTVQREGSELKDYLTMDNDMEPIELLDQNGIPLGATMPYGEIYCIIRSLWMHLAKKRDLAEGLPSPIPPVDVQVDIGPGSSSSSSSTSSSGDNR